MCIRDRFDGQARLGIDVAQVAGDAGHLVAALEQFVRHAGTHAAGNSDQSDFHGLAPWRVGAGRRPRVAVLCCPGLGKADVYKRQPGIRHSKSCFVLRRLKETMLPLNGPTS